MKIRNRLNPALLAILAMLAVVVVLISGKGGAATGVAQASAPNLPSVANSPHNYSAPDTDWSTPQPVLYSQGYDNRAKIAASHVNDAVSLIWGAAPDPDTGLVVQASNVTFNSPFFPSVLDANEPGLDEGIAAAADYLGRRHLIYWDWPRGGTLCDYYVIIGANGLKESEEVIPQSCDRNFPRKLAGLAIDRNNTAHMVLGRNGQTDSLRYWERTAAGVWTVQYEYVTTLGSPGDLALTVSNQGVTMVAVKTVGVYGGTDIYTLTRQGPDQWSAPDDISANCCVGCNGISGAYLPDLAPDSTGGIRAVWSDGRCYAGGQTDVYYREWLPGTGWENQPLVQVVYNSGISYWPSVAVDGSGEAHIAFSDDTSSPTNYYRIFYLHGRGTQFSGVQIPFTPWDRNSSWQKESDISYGNNYIHMAFSANRDDPNKNNYYSYLPVAPPVPTATPTTAPTATPIPPRCVGQHFKDVCPGDYFYTSTLNLYNDGIVSGYNTSPPCLNSLWVPCFNPYSSSSRGQISKMVVLSANLPINTAGGPHFQDVPSNSTFYRYIETMYNAGIISGYACGSAGEPCVPPANKPYFRPSVAVTRGQLSKMAALAFGLNDTPSGQTFQDVPIGSTYYTYTEQLASRDIINGYACGSTLTEPCIPPGNRPYFRPNNPVTRGQTTKILDALRSEPVPPTGTMTPTATLTPTVDTTTTVTVTPAVTFTATPPESSTVTPTVTGTPQLRR